MILAGPRLQDFFVRDILTIREVVDFAGSFVSDALACAIRSGSRDPAAFRPAEGFYMEKEESHAAGLPMSREGFAGNVACLPVTPGRMLCDVTDPSDNESQVPVETYR